VGGHIAANMGFPRQEVGEYREGMSLIKHYRVRHLFQERGSNFSLFVPWGWGLISSFSKGNLGGSRRDKGAPRVSYYKNPMQTTI
jgi:hypothetical protein